MDPSIIALYILKLKQGGSTMRELVKSILVLGKAIYSDEKEKNENQIDSLGFHTCVFPIQKEDLFFLIGFTLFDQGNEDLYQYKLIVEPKDWGSKCITIKYEPSKDLFHCQATCKGSGSLRKFEDVTMLQHIHDVLESISKERGI